MTWRELIESLKSYPDEVLDLDAKVWIDGCDVRLEGEYEVSGVTLEYPYEPASADNAPSMDIRL